MHQNCLVCVCTHKFSHIFNIRVKIHAKGKREVTKGSLLLRKKLDESNKRELKNGRQIADKKYQLLPARDGYPLTSAGYQ